MRSVNNCGVNWRVREQDKIKGGEVCCPRAIATHFRRVQGVNMMVSRKGDVTKRCGNWDLLLGCGW